MKFGVVAQQGGTQNPTNLVYNGNFENWAAGTSTVPDGWTSGGGSFARESGTIKIGTYSCKLFTSSSTMSQRIDAEKGIAYWQGRTVTMSCWVYASAASNAKLGLYDGQTYTFSDYHTGNSTWQLLKISKTLAANATSFYAYCLTDTTGTAYFDGATCMEGSSIFSYSPKVPIDYQTGTFTPTLAFGGGSTGMTYNTQYGAYTKIGNLVHVEIIIILTAKGSSTGNAVISTLPFTTNSVGQTGAIYFEDVSYTGSVLVYLGGSATTINLVQLVEAGTSSAITHTNFANNAYINIVLSYIAA